jgi:hypothetical protein
LVPPGKVKVDSELRRSETVSSQRIQQGFLSSSSSSSSGARHGSDVDASTVLAMAKKKKGVGHGKLGRRSLSAQLQPMPRRTKCIVSCFRLSCHSPALSLGVHVDWVSTGCSCTHGWPDACVLLNKDKHDDSSAHSYNLEPQDTGQKRTRVKPPCLGMQMGR